MELPKPRSVEEADRMLGDARIGLARIRRTIDALLDARLRLTGPPVCAMPSCGRVKSRFGSSVYLCPECDLLTCENNGCERRVRALDALTCNTCRRVPYSPWPPL